MWKSDKSSFICKNDKSHQDIAAQLKEHSIVRVYHAICYGILKDDEGDIEAPIGRSPSDRKKMAVTPGGKYASTHYRVLKRFEEDGFTYIECRLKTGRTHQIRVHAKYLGNPVVGDREYGYKNCKFNLNGQLLHAKKLEFIHPRTKEKMTFTCELPDYFQKVLKTLDAKE